MPFSNITQLGITITICLGITYSLLCSLVLSHDDVLDRKVGQGTDSHKMENWCEAEDKKNDEDDGAWEP